MGGMTFISRKKKNEALLLWECSIIYYVLSRFVLLAHKKTP